MQELKVLVNIEEVKELFDEGYEVIRVEVDEDGTTRVIQGNTSSRDFLFMMQLLEKADYDDFEDINEYKNWLNEMYSETIENDDYIVSIKFV